MSERTESKKRLGRISILALVAMMAGRALAAQSDLIPATHMPQRAILVSIPDRKLLLLEDGSVKRIYPIAVGKPSTPSPSGSFSIVRRISNPTYSHAGRIVAPGPKNPVGSRWMGLSLKGYGIHGTNEPDSIGKAASHGCIRMAKADLEDLYAQVQVGDSVEIHAEHDLTVALALDRTISTPPAETPGPPKREILIAAGGGTLNGLTQNPVDGE